MPGKIKKIKSAGQAEIISAVKLDDKLKKMAEKILADRGAKGEIKIKVDPSILGGLIIKVGNTVYDFSLSSRLETLAKQLKGDSFGS